jgi:hypothetical protein
MAMARRVFLSFHYERDAWRVQQVKQMGRPSHIPRFGCAARPSASANLSVAPVLLSPPTSKSIRRDQVTTL